jgi:hypothetical protein
LRFLVWISEYLFGIAIKARSCDFAHDGFADDSFCPAYFAPMMMVIRAVLAELAFLVGEMSFWFNHPHPHLNRKSQSGSQGIARQY